MHHGHLNGNNLKELNQTTQAKVREVKRKNN